jgi:hypothetical protein
MTDEDRLRSAQWILERQINWIATADIKVGAIVAIQTAMAGLLASAFSVAAEKSEITIAATTLAFCCTVGAFICASNALFPRTDGPENSLIFFGKISRHSRSDYILALANHNPKQLLEDCSAQVHRNAEIASEKHRWVKNGMIWTFIAGVPWTIALLNLAPLKLPH